MQQFVTPDDLDELDRRSYDLAIQPIPLAEVAVRLGISRAIAEERLERLYARLGVRSREELRELAANPRATAEEVPADEIGDAGEHSPEPEPTISRRRFIGTAAVVGVIVASGAGAILLRSSRGPAPKTGANGSADDSTQAALAPKETKPFPLTPTAGARATFVSETWDAGSPIGWDHGIFFMRAGDGRTEGFQFSPLTGGGPEWRSYSSFADGRVFAATNPSAGVGALVHRDNEARVWSWAASEYRLLAAYDDAPVRLLFESTNVRRTFHFVRLENDEAVESSSFTAESPPGVTPELIQQPQGPRIAIFHGAAATPEVAIFDLTTGKELARHAINAQAQVKDVFIPRTFQLLHGGFLAQWMTPTNGRGDIPPRYFSWPFAWDGNQKAFVREDREGTFIARDGVTAAVETWAEVGIPPADRQPFFRWPAVEVATTTDTVPPFKTSVGVRLRSAAVGYGDQLPSDRWLADGSGFVAAIRGGGDVAYRYAIVPANAEPIVVLPPPPQPDSPQWFDDPWVQGAVPHPTNRALISLGRLHLYNLVSGRMFSALLPGSGGPAHLDPWSGGADEMVFALPHGGHGGTPTPVMLAPKFETPPFDDTTRFVVAVDSTGLNMRAGPTAAAPSRRVLKNGERVSFGPPANSAVAEGDDRIVEAEGVHWLYVQAEDGLQGWVDSTWLAWA